MAVALLIVGIVLMFVRPSGLPLWVGPLVAAFVGVVTRVIRWPLATDALRLLRSPLLFLCFAVPLAVLLDHIGVFAALAEQVSGGRHLVLSLWVLAAGVTIVFNLDAAVVLLTPLYIHIAQRHGYRPEMLAFQPALMACLASNPLPVSNLTNLIVAEKFHLGVGAFTSHLGVPTLLACVVGWVAYHRFFGDGLGQASPIGQFGQVGPSAAPAGAPEAVDRDSVSVRRGGAADRGRTAQAPDTASDDGRVDRRALRRGLPIVGFVLAGFTLGDVVGIPGWAVAAAAVVWATLLTRQLAWRVVPYSAVLVAAGLSVLVAGAVPHLGIDHLLHGNGMVGNLQALGFGVVASNASNNLPAVLAGTSSLHHQSQVWSLLIGVNVGPVLVISGALSGLLWRDTAKRFDVHITARRYSQVGLRVGLPALVVAGAAVILL